MKKALLIILFSLIISPVLSSAQEVDLVWQGSGYTSPFYKGKAMWGKENFITFLAIPHGLGSASNLSYRWIRNGTVLGSLSGPGKRSLTISDSVLSRSQTIKVEVLAQDTYESPILATQSVTVSPIDQKVSVYENNPLYGVLFHKEVVGSYQLSDNEVSFAAFPFFFSGGSRENPNLSYVWSTNSGEVERSTSVTYRVPEGGRGSSRVNLGVTSPTSLLQTADNSFLVQFGNENE